MILPQQGHSKYQNLLIFPRHRRRGQLTSDSLERYQIQMGELKFIGKRVVYLAVMLFGVATLVFILTKMIPGDPVVANLSQRALNDPEIVAAYRAKHGLDRPLIVQYIYYIRDLLHFDLGTSIRTSRPVLDDLARCYPATLELALFSHRDRFCFRHPVWYHFRHPPQQYLRSDRPGHFRNRCQHSGLLVCTADAVLLLL